MPPNDAPPQPTDAAAAGDAHDRAILIVDDEPQVLAALRDLLEDDFRVITRTSPSDALEDVRNDPSIAVVLSDQRMAEMPGDELLARVRDLSHATRLLITGYSDLEAVVHAVNEGGIFGYISKPWAPKGLKITVLRAAEQFELVQELAQERALMQALMDNIPDGIYFKDRAHRYLRVNRAHLNALGVSDLAQVLGKTIQDFLEPDRAEMRHAEERRVLETGELLRDRIEQVVRPDGSLGWYAATKAAMRDKSGAVTGIVGITRDVTARIQGERERDLLLEVTRAFFEVDSFDGAIATILRLVCEHTGWDYGEAWGWDEESGSLRLFPAFHAPQDAHRRFRQVSSEFAFGPGEGMPGRVWKHRTGEWIEDMEFESADRFLRREEALRAGLRACFGVPVPGRTGKPLAVLIFCLPRARKEDAAHMRLVEAVAQKLGQALEAKRNEEAVRHREENLRTVLDNQTEMVTRLRPDGRRFYANPAMARFHDVPVEALDELSVWDTVASGDHAPLRRFWASLTPERPTGTITLRMRRHDGEVRHIEWTERGIFGDDGTLVEVQAAGRDVTDRLVAEHEASLAHGRLLAAIDSLPAGFAMFDADQRLVLCNDLYRADRPAWMHDIVVPGVTLEEIVRRTVEGGGYADAGEDIEAEIAQRMERWRNRPNRHEQKFSDGRWREIMEFPTPEGGTVLLRNDITAKKQADLALGESEHRLRSLLESASDTIILHDAAGRIVDANPAAAENLGYSRDELLQLTKFDIECGIEPDELKRQWQDGQGRKSFRGRHRCRDGSEFPVEVHVGRFEGADGPLYVAIARDMSEWEALLAELSRNEERFRTLIDQSAHGILVHSDFAPLYVNQALATMLGYDSPAEILAAGRAIHLFSPDEHERLRGFAEARMRGEPVPESYEVRCIRRDGTTALVENRAAVVPWDDGWAICASMIDVTERRETEQKLQQAQKMEAVGQLTGGIAHDFNNLLTVVMGNLEMLGKRLEKGDDEKLKKWASNAGRAATRGADLTRRLLAFSSRQMLEPVVLDVNDTVRDMMDMLARGIGEDVELVTQLDDDVGAIRADPAQFESAVLNLAVNARDAMPDGGRLVIETSRFFVGEHDDKAMLELDPGSYVVISVTDTGTGMPPEVREKVFEPFFTTKETGKGSGLGLSMIFGFVKQSGGHASIYSEVGQGTTVKLYFPRVAAAEREDAVDAERPAHSPASDAVVLVVEDDESVRETAESMLETLGYRVLTAEDGHAALDLLRKHPEIDVLFTDIVMPGGLTGVELAWKARTLRPGLPVLYTSGYAEAALKKTDGAEADAHWLAKPYTVGQLAVKLGEVMEG